MYIVPAEEIRDMIQIELTAPYRLRLREAPDPGHGAGHAVVRIRRVGICGTDLHAIRGRQPFFTYPRVLGHELAAEILEIGPNDQGWRRGDCCVVFPYFECGICVACRRGKTNCCVHMQVLGVHLDGGLGEYLSLPVDRLVPAEGLTLERMALVENQCIGAHAVSRSGLTAADTVLVMGAGPIGMGVMQFACKTGARVLVADISESRLEFCRRRLGMEQLLVVDGDFEARLAETTGGDLPTVVFDATGHAESMERGFATVAHGGNYVLVGLVQSMIKFWDPDFHRKEISLLSSRNATRDDFDRVIAAMQDDSIVVDPMVTHSTPFAAVPDQYEAWLDPAAGVVKAMVCL